jgi:Fur family ferric uptake transcriptional regulator
VTSKERLISLLRQHHLNITHARIKILELFLNNENALDNHLIEKKVQHQLGRITIYRTLRSFLKKGIIHTIPTHDFSVHYALCKNSSDEQSHFDNHLHFICENCGKAFCLDEKNISFAPLPNDYIINKVDVLLTGVCKICSTRKSLEKTVSL